MKVPKEFKVFSSTISVEFDSQELSNNNLLGECSHTHQKIRLCDNYKGEELSESSILDTFYHEKVHIVLDAMGEHELSENEKFVEIFSRLLRQTEESAKF